MINEDIDNMLTELEVIVDGYSDKAKEEWFLELLKAKQHIVRALRLTTTQN
jgi:predicted dinucleotide-utilizing enzyme